MSLTQSEASNLESSCLIRLRCHRIKICTLHKSPLGRAFQQLEILLNCKISFVAALFAIVSDSIKMNFEGAIIGIFLYIEIRRSYLQRENVQSCILRAKQAYREILSLRSLYHKSMHISTEATCISARTRIHFDCATCHSKR